MARRTTNVTHGATPNPEPDPHGTPPRRTDPGYEDPHMRQSGSHGHGHEDDEYVEFTTPQGTQWHAVDGGHEERDVDVPALIKWGIGVFVLTGVTCGLLLGAFTLVLNQEKSRPRPTSVMMQPTIPPLPRLIPNPVDEAERSKAAGRPANNPLPLQDPIAYHLEQKALEAPEIQALGLLDRSTHLPTLPDGAVEAVNAMNAQGGAVGSPATGDTIEWRAPSDMSGGVNNEDRLR